MSHDSSSGKATEKLIELEEKLMFQQRALEELNEVVIKQQGEIDELRSELSANRKLIQDLTERSLGADLPHEKPPHY